MKIKNFELTNEEINAILMTQDVIDRLWGASMKAYWNDEILRIPMEKDIEFFKEATTEILNFRDLMER